MNPTRKQLSEELPEKSENSSRPDRRSKNRRTRRSAQMRNGASSVDPICW